VSHSLPVRHSINEIEVALRKAATGAGYPYGLAEDIGQAAGWLCARGQDGVRACLAGIGYGYRPPLMAADGKTFSDARVAACGPSALDLLFASEPGGGVRLTAVDAPLLLVGLAGARAEAWSAAIELAFSDGCTFHVAPAGFEATASIPNAGVDVVISHAGGAGTSDIRAATANGVEVEPGLWARVQALAAKTYVTASETSRESGAGAGNIDND